MPDDDIELLQQLITHGGTQAFSLVPAALKKVIDGRQWEKRFDKDGKPFRSFEAFVNHRLWHGLESSIDDLRIYCRKHPAAKAAILTAMEPVATHQEAGAKGGRGKKPIDNVNSFSGDGNSATYTLKRLKRDRPDLFQQVIGGAISVNEAAIEAGFRKRMFSVPDDVQLATAAIVKRFGLDDVASTIERLRDENVRS